MALFEGKKSEKIAQSGKNMSACLESLASQLLKRSNVIIFSYFTDFNGR